MPDFSPWGSQAMAGAGGYTQPGIANTLPYAQNQGMPAPPMQGFTAPPGGSLGGGGMIPRPGGTIGGYGMPGDGGAVQGPFGAPMNPGVQSPFGGQSQMRNPMMSLLLPMILQRMGMVNRPGGPSGFGDPGGTGGSVGGPIPPNMIPRPGGTPPRAPLIVDNPGVPRVQTASPFDMIGGNAVPQNFGPAMNAFLPPSMGGQAPGIPPATPAPPPHQILQTDRTGIPRMAPAAAMAQQAQQAQIANTLTNMSNMGPQQNMMAQLLMQQMPFMYR